MGYILKVRKPRSLPCKYALYVQLDDGTWGLLSREDTLNDAVDQLIGHSYETEVPDTQHPDQPHLTYWVQPPWFDSPTFRAGYFVVFVVLLMNLLS